MATLPSIPPLPEPTNGAMWSGHIQEAHLIIVSAHGNALQSYTHNNGDALRLKLTISDLHPVKVVVTSLLTEGLDKEYVMECIQAVLALERALELSARAAAGEYVERLIQTARGCATTNLTHGRELHKVHRLKLVCSEKRRGCG